MAGQLLKPRIALVANSIVFQREESKLTNLDTLTMQVCELFLLLGMKLIYEWLSLSSITRGISI